MTHLCLGTIAQQVEPNELLHLFDYLCRFGLLNTAGHLFGQIIRMETPVFLQHADFADLNPQVLSWLLNQRSLKVTSELDLFDACIQWAKTACDKAGLEPSSTNVRKSLGQLVFLLRIPSMCGDDLVKTIETGIFDEQEQQILLQHKEQERQQMTDGITTDTPKHDFLLQFINGFFCRKRPCTVVVDLPYCPIMNQGKNCYVRPDCRHLSDDFRCNDPMRPQILLSLWVSRFTYLIQVCFRVRLEYERFEIQVLNDSNGQIYYEQTLTTRIKDNLINVSFQNPILFPPNTRLLITARAVLDEELNAEPDSMRSTFFNNDGDENELQIRYKADVFYPARFNVQFFKLF